MSPEIHTLTTPGLGSSTFVVSHDGVAFVVDPSRDIDNVARVINDLGADPALVLETHVHNDFVSGGYLASNQLGARLLLPTGSGVRYPHLAAADGDELAAGGLTIRVAHTPGHTPEHVAYVVLLEGRPQAVFTGGSLLVGSIGRSDLLDDDLTPGLLHAQFASVHRLAALPDHVTVHPTHGTGSFCTTSETGSSSSTIGEERRTNPFFTHLDAEAFAAAAPHRDQAPFPAYFPFIAPINRCGPTPPPTDPLPLLDLDGLVQARIDGVHLVDTRPKTAFAEGHIPGSFGIELGPDFATWVGWLLPFDAPLVLIAGPSASLDDARRSLARIGFDDIRGVVYGIDAWTTTGRAVRSHATMTARKFVDLAVEDPQILDVRAPNEWDDTLGDVIRHHLPDLAKSVPDRLDRSRPVYIGCTTGHRASTAAGILADEGFQPVVLVGASLVGVAHLRSQRT